MFFPTLKIPLKGRTFKDGLTIFVQNKNAIEMEDTLCITVSAVYNALTEIHIRMDQSHLQPTPQMQVVDIKTDFLQPLFAAHLLALYVCLMFSKFVIPFLSLFETV